MAYVNTTFFPKTNYIKDFATRLAARIQKGRVYTLDGGGGGGIFDDATLDLNFAVTKTLDPKVTFTRASTGTYVGSNGLIETAKVNYIRYSQDFTNTAWTFGGVTSPAGATSEVTPPGGVNYVYKVLETSGTSSEHYFRAPYTSLPLAVNTVITNSIYLNTSIGRSKVRVFCYAQNNLTFIWDLVSNAIVGSFLGGTNPSANSENLGNGWYRLSWTDAVTVPGNMQPQIGFVNDSNEFRYIGDITKGMYVTGFQLEEGATTTTYVPTTSVANGAPRFDHDPTTGESLGLLIEESRTNLLLQSEDFSTTWLSAAPYTVTPNATVAPNGQQTADAVVIDNGQSSFSINVVRQTITKAASALTYTHSAYYKALGAGTSVRIANYGANTTDTVSVVVSLADGSIIGNPTTTGAFSNGSASVTTLNDGWYRVSVTFTTDTATSLTVRAFPYVGLTPLVGDGTSGLYLWGAQLEAGSFPTSYIPTSGATATRATDIAEITGTNFSSWYNQSEGTLFSETKGKETSGGGRDVADISDGTGSSNRILLRDHQLFITNSDAIQTNIGFTDTLNNTKTAAAFTLNDAVIYSDGLNKGTDTSLTLPTVDRIHIGSYNFGGEQLCGCIARFAYWPTRLPDEQLQEITQ